MVASKSEEDVFLPVAKKILHLKVEIHSPSDAVQGTFRYK
jgi:hypothetical protein